MKLNIPSIIATAFEVGSDLPAYKALFDQVVNLFDEDDQETLKAGMAEALAAADAQHRAAQSL
jgi:hypothetical protein